MPYNSRMNHLTNSRREFLASIAAVPFAGGAAGYFGTAPALADKPRWSVERAGVGAIGMRYQGSVIANIARQFGDIVAVCDVDGHVRDQAKASFGTTPQAFVDYRQLLQHPGVDVVLIGTPDHWHAKMLIDAVRAGKHVYVEKPLTLTVAEGDQVRRAVSQTDRVVQVGSWQRSDHRFRQAVEMVRQGRIGKLQRVEVVLGKNQTGGPFRIRQPPSHLNWDLWQGQTPDVPYREQRCHYTFRWWYEYSGGQMTDWGAHHIDIAQWAIDSLPVAIEGQATFPSIDGGYNVAEDFSATFRYANGVTMTVSDTGRNGVMFYGDRGRIFVNRGVLSGKPVEELAQQPLEREKWLVYAHDNLKRPPRMGKLDAIKSHMGNLFDCIANGNPPISDVDSQHRSVTTCHLGNISMRLGRALKWDAANGRFVDDAQANLWLSRPQRAGFEIA